jgi:hypothetical protein
MSVYSFTSSSGAVSNGAGVLTVGETSIVATITINTSGTYYIDADGAQGGAGHLTGGTHGGGLGAAVGGDIFLTAGTTLEIVVGAEGLAAGYIFGGDGGGGGGGGTYVFEGSDTAANLLAVAGGGGGGAYGGGGSGGQASTHGAAGAGGGQGGAGLHGGDGGGAAGNTTPWGGGGGGFTGGNGAAGGPSGPTGFPGTVATGGFHFQGGAGSNFSTAAGQFFDTGGNGGFGGGGGGGIAGGGGGGGYGGGGGGGLSGGGGGGSYLSTSLSNTTESGGAHSGDGLVTITLEPALCFVSGTLIATTRGEVAVEALSVGDLAVTASGEPRPIMWLGHKRVACPALEQWPVRVQAGAFGDNLPARDLMLSPGHAVCISVVDDVFVPVGELINGATIAQVEVSEVTYWHIELESHDVLLAEGLACESYMDAGNRAWFGREYGRLDAVDPERIAESLTRYARPFVDRGPLVEAIRQRLNARAEAMGWTRASDMDLHLVIDGDRIDPTIDGDLARFVLPADVRTARLVSRTFVPGADRRKLGVRIKRLAISDGLRLDREVPLEALGEGVYGLEQDGERPWRWTDGDAVLPASLWHGCNGLAILTVGFASNAEGSWIAPTRPERRAAA